MPYIIDGHNLIPRLPGFSLSAADDEVQLIELLQEFCRLRRKQAEIYFDNAPPGQPRVRSYGLVTARFIRASQTADSAIRAHLGRLGAAARNWIVVSSDQEVQRAGRAARAQVISSEAFSRQVTQALQEGSSPGAQPGEAPLSPDEIQDWLDLFGSNHSEDTD
jgi:hypothetical protein